MPVLTHVEARGHHQVSPLCSLSYSFKTGSLTEAVAADLCQATPPALIHGGCGFELTSSRLHTKTLAYRAISSALSVCVNHIFGFVSCVLF